jgi:hypothetical protein
LVTNANFRDNDGARNVVEDLLEAEATLMIRAGSGWVTVAVVDDDANRKNTQTVRLDV